jgi:conjugative transposon TraK protein
MEAVAGSRKDNISVEAAHHVEMLHAYFYSLSPDEKAIQSTIGRALYLADKSAKTEYDNLRESGYYSNLIAGNISQDIKVDSVSIDLQQYPYHFVCRATQTFTRTSSIVLRSLVTEGFVREVSRSENNPHGFLVERWTVLENSDIKTEKR